jgi:hypothetical protein
VVAVDVYLFERVAALCCKCMCMCMCVRGEGGEEEGRERAIAFHSFLYLFVFVFFFFIRKVFAERGTHSVPPAALFLFPAFFLFYQRKKRAQQHLVEGTILLSMIVSFLMFLSPHLSTFFPFNHLFFAGFCFCVCVTSEEEDGLLLLMCVQSPRVRILLLFLICVFVLSMVAVRPFPLFFLCTLTRMCVGVCFLP